MLSSTACPDYSGKSRKAGKSFLQTLFFFFLVTQICFAQWYKQNPLITQNTLNDVTLIDENTGWGVGDSGTIIKTTDGGLSWIVQESNTDYSLRGVCFVDINNGWAVGDSGTIIRTMNGGLDWGIQSSGIIAALNDVDFVNITTGTVVGDSGKILRTTNSGITWNLQISGVGTSLLAVCFTSLDYGWAVGSHYPDGSIGLRTTNGGLNWLPYNIDAWLYGVFFIDSNNGWIVGTSHDAPNGQGRIFRTTNGGLTWISQTSGTIENLVDVYFTDMNNGWAVAGRFDNYSLGNGIILNTTDGGMNWTRQASGTVKSLQSLTFINSNKGIVVGENGTIKYTDNSGIHWESPPGGSTNDWTDVSFTDLNNGVVMGDGGTIVRTTNGGTSWTQVVTGTTNDFTAMSFIDANEGWAVTGIIHGFHTELRDSSFIFHTTDSGETWTKQLTMPLTLFNDVSFVDANNGWAVGASTDSIWWISSYGIILRTTNGGVTWNQTINDTIYGNKVYFVDENNGWILSNEYWKGRILRTTDGGNTWALQFETTNAYYAGLNDIVSFDLNKAFAVGIFKQGSIFPTEGLIVKTTDGGASWTQTFISFPPDPSGIWRGLNGVFFSNASNGIVVGGSGVIYQTSDSGISWNSQTSGTTNSLNGVFFIDALNGWAVGDNGIILHTTNGGVSFVEEEVIDEIPTEFLLSNNYPNPFNPNTKIKYSIPQSSNVVIKVFDILGNEIETLVNEEKPAGSYEVTWYAEGLPSGVYFYQKRAGSFIVTKKMLLLK